MQVVLLAGAVAAWAALHSWLASMRMKAVVASRLGPHGSRAYRLTYNSISVISLAPIAWLLWKLPDRQIYAIPVPWAFVLLGIQAVAASLAAVTLLQTDAFHFAGISQILGREGSNRLATSGFYRFVRHPLYLFGLILLWLSPRMSVNQLVMTAVLSAYFFVGAALEEGRLVQEFGEAYESYRASTPMILPGARHRPKS